MSAVEYAGGGTEADFTRTMAPRLRDGDGRWFGTFPAHWPEPPMDGTNEDRADWIVANARKDGGQTGGATARQTTGMGPGEARARLAELAARGRQLAAACGDARAARALLEERRVDPEQRREAGRLQARHRLLRQQLVFLLRESR